MELKFTKDAQSGNWVSEYEAKAVFNLHIEGAKKLRLYQRTAGSRYDEIEGEYKDGAYSFDYDFNALVYPKYIKIVSETEPTYAEVVSDGEITEIKSQTKEVEVTANGTTQVAPDAGYSYLTGVTVKTNVPQSGGSGGSGLEYIDTSNEDFKPLAEVGTLSHVVKVRDDDGTIIVAPPTMAYATGQTLDMDKLMKTIAFGFSPSVRIMGGIFGEEGRTIAEFGGELLAKAPRITEEEFYNLEGGGITDKFVSIRELYQPTKEEVDLGAEPQLMNVENCDRVTEVKVNFATEYEDVGKDNNFILFDKANSSFMNVSIFANNYVGMKCLFSIESAESGYSSYSPFAVTSEGTITTDENAVKEINSILANGDFRYIALGNFMNLTDAEFDTIDKFIKVKTV